MPFSCPKCQSRDLRYARIRSFSERFRSWFGIHPLRCRECHQRFIERTWQLGLVKYARCPRCWRLDLSRWSTENYYVSPAKRLLLKLGAQPYRCEYCRTNFVSFRHRKEHHRWHRRGGEQRAGQPASEAAAGKP